MATNGGIGHFLQQLARGGRRQRTLVGGIVLEGRDQLLAQLGLHLGGHFLLKTPCALDVGGKAVERGGVARQVAIDQQKGLHVEIGQAGIEQRLLAQQILQDTRAVLRQLGGGGSRRQGHG